MSTRITSVSPGIYQIEGDLTFRTVNLLQQLPKQILTSKIQPKIALNKVQHIDSAGLALLIDWTRQTINNPVIFIAANDQLLRLATLYNLDKTLPLHTHKTQPHKQEA
ncbi:MAG: STAS domain-containing protein [Methylococcales bacterium]